MNALTQLKEFQSIFSPFLVSFFKMRRKKIEDFWPLAKDMFEKLAEFTLRGGKRTRPALLYYSYQGFSEENPEKLLPICVACELMQSFLLIHDDIMDQSDIRRGGKTIHQQFPQAPNEYGASMAILIGNLAGYLGIQAMMASEFDSSIKSRLMDFYAQICIDAGYGQALDISLHSLNALTEENIYTIYRYKTARYTTEFPLLSMATLTNCNDETTASIKKLGIDLGILFQLQDDILGSFGDEQKMGKQSSIDLLQGKKTLLIYKAFEKANKEQKENLIHIYGNLQATPSEITLAKKIMVETGALDYANEIIKKRSDSALNIIEQLTIKPVGKNFLQDLVYYCGNREH